MTKTKKTFASVIAFVLICCTLFALCIPAAAATRSRGTQTCTITVYTKANYWLPGAESITIGQSKGTCVKNSYNIFSGRTTQKSSSQYGCWDIQVRATDGSHSYRKTLSGSSVKLNLKPNKVYKITISWDSGATFFKTVNSGSFVSYPSWNVRSTWKVSSYY